MFVRRLLTTVAVVGLMAVPALAQAPVAPTKPATTAPAIQTPTSQTARPLASVTTPVAKKTNINIATVVELDALPDVGKIRSKAIMDERAKGAFKDWADFEKRMAGTSVNAGVKSKIRDLVTF